MTEPSSRKEGFKKCRSATFSIDGFSFTIVANEAGDKNARPLARFARSKSQNSLWNSIISGLNLKEKQKPTIATDPRSPEEILADELPQIESPDAIPKASISTLLLQICCNVFCKILYAYKYLGTTFGIYWEQTSISKMHCMPKECPFGIYLEEKDEIQAVIDLSYDRQQRSPIDITGQVFNADVNRA